MPLTEGDWALYSDTPVVLGHYPDQDVLEWAIIVIVPSSMLLGAAGRVVLIVGLVMRAWGRRANPAAA